MLLYFILTAGVFLALDQASKALALRLLTRGELLPIASRFPVGFRLLINGWIRPSFLKHRGILFFFWTFAVSGSILASFLMGFNNPAVCTCLGIAVGGATGNLLDRLRKGAIIDFIDIHVWPVFNLADLGIVLGVAGVLLSLLVNIGKAG